MYADGQSFLKQNVQYGIKSNAIQKNQFLKYYPHKKCQLNEGKKMIKLCAIKLYVLYNS